jgi:ribosomal protein S27E
MSKEPSSNFLKVECSCCNEQVIFGKVASKVKCSVCNKPLTKPSGGKTVVLAKVVKVI